MRKSEMLSLEKGIQIQHKRNGQVLTVVAVQEDKIVCEEKTISVSNCTRWFDVVEIPEVVEPDNTILDDIEQADELTSEQDTDTTATTATNTQVNELHDDTDKTTKTHTTEGNTAINGQEIFENSISGIVIKHGCKLNRMKQYIAVRSNTVKGTLVYIRVAKEGGYHFDIGKTTWNKLDTDTQVDLVEQFDACIKDRTRGLWRISNCDSLDIFEKLLTTALDIA